MGLPVLPCRSISRSTVLLVAKLNPEGIFKSSTDSASASDPSQEQALIVRNIINNIIILSFIKPPTLFFLRHL
jgi:hypothetical protein